MERETPTTNGDRRFRVDPEKLITRGKIKKKKKNTKIRLGGSNYGGPQLSRRPIISCEYLGRQNHNEANYWDFRQLGWRGGPSPCNSKLIGNYGNLSTEQPLADPCFPSFLSSPSIFQSACLPPSIKIECTFLRSFPSVSPRMFR